MRRLRTWAVVAGLLATLGAAPTAAHPRAYRDHRFHHRGPGVGLRVYVAPTPQLGISFGYGPRVRTYVPRPAPAPYVWVPGGWVWQGYGYVYVPGHWQPAPYSAYPYYGW